MGGTGVNGLIKKNCFVGYLTSQLEVTLPSARPQYFNAINHFWVMWSLPKLIDHEGLGGSHTGTRQNTCVMYAPLMFPLYS